MKFFIFIISLIISSNSFASCIESESKSNIVVAGGSITEIIYFLKAEKNLIGVDITSNYPKEAKKLPSIGYIRNLSIEGILSLKPDLILAEEDVGPPVIKEQLKNTSIDFRIIQDDFTEDGINNKILCISNILNLKLDENVNYENFIQNLKSLKKIKKENLYNQKKILIILMMKGTSPIVAGNNTSGDGFINMLGHLNIMNEVNGWKPVSYEEILLSNPDYIIITERAFRDFSSLDALLSIPGIASTTAGKNKNIIVKDGMSVLGFSPRTIEQSIDISQIINR